MDEKVSEVNGKRIPEDKKKIQEDEIEEQYKYEDDIVGKEQSYGSKEKESYDEGEGKLEEKSGRL